MSIGDPIQPIDWTGAWWQNQTRPPSLAKENA
jgi:hypothetical protein